MAKYHVEAVAYDKDGRRLNGNTHSVEASTDRDAERLAASRQKFQVETVRVETRITSKIESKK